MPHCTECAVPHMFPTVHALYLHLKICHEITELKVFRCKESECSKDFTDWKSFAKHLTHSHSCNLHSPSETSRTLRSSNLRNSERIVDDPIKYLGTSNNSFCEQALHSHESFFQCAGTSEHAVPEPVIPVSEPSFVDSDIPRGSFNEPVSNLAKEKLRDIVQMFCAKFYATPDLPRSYVQNTFDNTKELIDNIISTVKPALYEAFECTEVQMDKVSKIFDSMTLSFQSMSTEYRRLKSFEDVGFISPRSYIVGSSVDNKFVEGKVIKVMGPVHAQCIPLRDTLHCFFSLPGVLRSVLNYMSDLMSDCGFLCNFIQGQLWRDKVNRYFSDKTVIPLFIYYDDFEVNNPLGSHKGIQKIGGVYCSVPCLPPQFCSAIENIFLVLLFHATDRKTFGNESIFKILVDQLNDLQDNGITFELDGVEKKIYFSLGLITGDNLGINSAFDFVESFRSSRYCRICNITGKEGNIDCTEKIDRLRRSTEYENDLKAGQSESGIKKRSVWNDVKYFHVYENYYMDPLHDLAEGALKYGMAHVLHYYVFDAKNKINLDLVNDRMLTFNYTANNITNKPPLIKWIEAKDKKLSMTGSEMTNFVYIFPLLVGDSIVLDEVWDYFRTLRNILFIVSAKKIQVECAVLLDRYVREHHTLYKKLFKDTLKAKHHNLVHYARVMKMSGPLCTLSTMRNESKNRQFKQSANATYSRRNITHTLAMKEAFALCHRKMCQKGLVEKFDIGPGNVIERLPDVNYYSSLSNTDFKTNSIEVPWVILKGITYRIGSCLVLQLDSRDIPVFGQIEVILSNESGNIVFGCIIYSSKQFVPRFDAWEVERTEKVEFWEPASLFTPFICILHRVGSGEQFATPKHAL